MPNVRISDAADAGTLLSSDMLPLARSGNTNAYHATMTEIANFASTSLASGAYGNVGRNLVHNPLMNVAQRGAGAFDTNGAYTADRYVMSMSLDTANATIVALPDANRATIGDEAAEFAHAMVFTGNAGAASYTVLWQRIEDVRRLGGKTVTVSFWAWCGTGALNLGISLDQDFGTGGSPSPQVNGAGQAVAISPTLTRYSKTFALASTLGMTLGTSRGDFTALNLWFSSGTAQATRAGNIGVQSGTVYLWGVQLEVGSVATPLEKPDPRYDLSNCQRFYQLGTMIWSISNQTGGANFQVTRPMAVEMRAAPTVNVIGTPTFANISGFGFAASTTDVWTSGIVSATGPACVIAANIYMSADL